MSQRLKVTNEEDPCGVREFMARTSVTLSRLESFEVVATGKLEKLEDMEKSLATIAAHSGDTASQLQSLRSDMKEWVPLIAGKNHVPLHIFLIVIIVMAIISIVTVVSQGGGEFEAGYNKLKYRSYPLDERSFNEDREHNEKPTTDPSIRRRSEASSLP